MKEPATYTQCVLHRATELGTAIDCAWIPTPFAKKGKVLKIKDSKGEWVNGWIVAEVGAAWPTDKVINYEMDYRHQREVSDI
jgi:hypothetical protein